MVHIFLRSCDVPPVIQPYFFCATILKTNLTAYSPLNRLLCYLLVYSSNVTKFVSRIDYSAPLLLFSILFLSNHLYYMPILELWILVSWYLLLMCQLLHCFQSCSPKSIPKWFATHLEYHFEYITYITFLRRMIFHIWILICQPFYWLWS